jgi:hypothetical protein
MASLADQYKSSLSTAIKTGQKVKDAIEYKKNLEKQQQISELIDIIVTKLKGKIETTILSVSGGNISLTYEKLEISLSNEQHDLIYSCTIGDTNTFIDKLNERLAKPDIMFKCTNKYHHIPFQRLCFEILENIAKRPPPIAPPAGPTPGSSEKNNRNIFSKFIHMLGEILGTDW